MKTTVSLAVICVLFTTRICAQEFQASVSNPFGINIDTSGGVGVYSCTFADIDGDNDLDIIYPYFNDSINLAFQENIGTKTNPFFDSINKLNIQFNAAVGFFFPEFADMNNDGLVDIISFGSLNDSTGFNITYFENKGNNRFESKPGAEIGLPGIGYALGIPEIVDLNQDGDMDIILSGATLETFTDESDVMFYYGQNSSPTDPEFVAWFIEPYSFSFMDTFQSAIIRTGDLDLDGDLDLLMSVGVTDEETKYMYQENISPPNEKSDFTGPQLISPFGLPEESEGLPFLEDLDGDGDLDLFVFDDLNIFYYENTACVNTVSELDASICEGESFSLNDETYTRSGTYTQMLTNSNGCDSLITLNLIVNEAKTSQFEELICEGSSYLWNGEAYGNAGEYDQSFVSANGCDSTVTLKLTVTSPLESSFTASFCTNGEYIWNNMSYNKEGSYIQSLSTDDGCDSIVTLVLTETSTLATSFTASFCAGEEYIWNDMSYSEVGIYSQSFISNSGCDSIVELDLTQISIEYTLTQENGTLKLSNEGGAISWVNCDTNAEVEGENTNSFTPIEAGNYAVKIEEEGCLVISDCISIMSSSLESEIAIPEIHLFPNPANDFVSIEAEDSNIRFEKFTFINLAGQRLTKEIIGNTIDISDLQSGFYYVKIKTNSNTLVRSLVIVN